MNKKRRSTGETDDGLGDVDEDIADWLTHRFALLATAMRTPEGRETYDMLYRISEMEILQRAQKQQAGKRQAAEPDVPTDMPTTPDSARLPLSRANELSYPCMAAASLNSFETGGGHVLGLLVASVLSAEELRDEAVRAWGERQIQNVEVHVWTGGIDKSTQLSADPVQVILDRSVFEPSALRYVTTLNVSYA